jgi:hypothetical protein
MASVTLQMLKGYLERFGWSRYQAVDEPYEQEGHHSHGLALLCSGARATR